MLNVSVPVYMHGPKISTTLEEIAQICLRYLPLFASLHVIVIELVSFPNPLAFGSQVGPCLVLPKYHPIALLPARSRVLADKALLLSRLSRL